jgi:hypothetical protein
MFQHTSVAICKFYPMLEMGGSGRGRPRSFGTNFLNRSLELLYLGLWRLHSSPRVSRDGISDFSERGRPRPHAATLWQNFQIATLALARLSLTQRMTTHQTVRCCNDQ